MVALDADPIRNLAQELAEVIRVACKPRLIAKLRAPTLMSLNSVTSAVAGEHPYDRASALVDQIETAIVRFGVGSRLNEAALVLFGLDPDARDLTLQDRRDRAAQIVGIRGGWDSFRKGPEKRILREVGEQLYRLEHSGEGRLDRIPKRSLASCQLPADVAHFTGRETELAYLKTILANGRAQGMAISAIAGTGGVGKTALALHLAHELAPRFPDAQLYVNLHGYDQRERLPPARVLDRFLRALGVADEALPTTLDEQIALYRSLLFSKRALVVLDNASSADQVRVLLPASPTCLVLITSRDRLTELIAGEGVRLLVLDVLAPKEAVELLSRMTGAERIRSEPEAATEIGRLCGHLPLAVRIAAARLAARPSMSLASLAQRLADEQQRLGELRAGDMGVRASFALSYQALDPSTARLFRHLGLIAGPDFGPGVAAALVGTTPVKAENLLETLVDANLLEAAPTAQRYRFHDLLRLYARECLHAEEAQQEQTDARNRLLSWYLEAADAATQCSNPDFPRLPRESQDRDPGPAFATVAEALEWLEVERPSLVAAVHQAVDWGRHEIGWQLPNILWSFFFLRKHWADWEDVYQRGLTAARSAWDRRAEAWMLGGLGEVYADLRRYEEALTLYRDALVICREVEDRYIESWTLFRLGRVYAALRRHEEALDLFRDALVISREIEDRYTESWILYQFGQVHAALRRHDEALIFYQEALSICRAMGNRYGEGWTLYRLSRVHAALRRHDEALTFCQEALAICREVGDRWGEGWILRHLGVLFRHVQDIEAAHARWQEALTIFTELRTPLANEVRTLLEEEGVANSKAIRRMNGA